MLGASAGIRLIVFAACAIACRPPSRGASVHLDRLLSLPTTGTTILGVVSDGPTTFVAEPDAIHILVDSGRSHSIVAPGSRWESIATMRALDSQGRWIVATDHDGHIWRIHTSGALDELGSRLRIEQASNVLASEQTTAFVGKDRIAIISDGVHRRDYVVAGRSPAIDNERFAQIIRDHVELWDLKQQTRVRFKVPNAKAIAFFRGRMIVRAPDAVYVQTGDSLRKHRLHEVRAIASGKQLWVLTRDQLLILEGESLRPTDVSPIDVHAMFGDRRGVWLAGSFGLQRLQIADDDDAREWRTSVRPIFTRVCSECHLPGGAAALDLSTIDAWVTHRTQIAEQISTYAMPPRTSQLSEADRATLLRWLRAPL